MSKKHKKKFRKQSASVALSPAINPSIFTRSSEFNPDYSYVIRDLKRIGSLAVFFLTVLVVLAFILR